MPTRPRLGELNGGLSFSPPVSRHTTLEARVGYKPHRTLPQPAVQMSTTIPFRLQFLTEHRPSRRRRPSGCRIFPWDDRIAA